MDLLDFNDCKLYFEDPPPAEAERLIAKAAKLLEVVDAFHHPADSSAEASAESSQLSLCAA